MKLLVLNYEYPPLGGGAGVVTQNISEGLAKLGHNITVVTTWFMGENEIEEKENLKVIRLRSKRKYNYRSNVYEMLSWAKASKLFLSDYCKLEKFDLCFANYALQGGSVALFLNKKFKLNYVILSHGHDIPWMFPRQMFFYHLLTCFRIRRICKDSEMNIMLTKEMKRNSDRFLNAEVSDKNIVIPNGVDFNSFNPDHSKRSKLLKIIFVGRLVPQKDPLTFLRSVELYSRKNRNISVHIIGDGELRPEIERFISSHGMKDLIKLTGWLPKEKVVEEYQSSHLQVISSVYEAMSVSALESLACGCFLVSTPLNGMHELTEPGVNVSFVDFNSPDEIAKSLEEYHDHKFLSGYNIPQSSIDRLKMKYSWEYLVENYEKQLLNVIEG